MPVQPLLAAPARVLLAAPCPIILLVGDVLRVAPAPVRHDPLVLLGDEEAALQRSVLRTNIPCTIRDSLKHVAGRSFNFKADGNRGVRGASWFGDFANDGESDEDVEGEGAGVEVFNIESDEDDHEEGDAQEVVYTQGCVLSGVEESLLDVVLANNDGYIGSFFIHRLTTTNITKKIVKIPRKVAQQLNLPPVGVAGESGTEKANTTGAGLSKLRAASLGGEAMEDGDGEQPDQLLQSKGNTESKHDSKMGMEDALLDKGSEPLFESDSDIAVDKRTDSEINANLSEAEISDGVLCDGVINMLRKILDTKETREIVRQKTLKRPRSSNELKDKPNNGVVPKAYSRCSVPYFVDVVKTTRKSQSKVDLVKGIGFAYLLELDDSVVPRHFTQWVADKVCVEDQIISINNRAITLNAESALHVFGIPAGETIISTSDDGGKDEFLALFGLSEVPRIKFFGKKIIK
ncbi:hypothetical protein D1007_09987 [Hordeum vulgare]|nr:hypothetical protein D1007_09987 [Hordeum vulgare]